MTERICDKCGEPVALKDDRAVLDYFRKGRDEQGVALEDYLGRHKAWHILPHTKTDGTVCEGSPSRAQYLEGQPKDERGIWYTSPYTAKFEPVLREAYAKQQALPDEA